MKTCLIYGHNGLDLDVTFNLIPFYQKLGFKVFFSEKLYNADLLVVLRAINNPIDLSSFDYAIIHVFDYVGWDYDNFIKSINPKITYIFCTSELKRKRIIEKLNFPKENIFLAFPPVEITLWTSNKKKENYEVVHVGNFKPIVEEDEVKERFHTTVSDLNCHIWGINWENNVKNNYHGKVGLFNVSSIYANSKFALGLMYPFQRGVTYSGRFWHAPLNGCYVFSEPGIYTTIIPGIIETDYTTRDIKEKLSLAYDRNDLIKQSKQYWESNNLLTLAYVKSTLIENKSSFSLNKLLIFLRIKSFNFLRKYYQKAQIFKLKIL